MRILNPIKEYNASDARIMRILNPIKGYDTFNERIEKSKPIKEDNSFNN